MKVRRSERDGIPVLHLEGEFDSFETDLVRNGFDACMADGHKSVVLDLSEMTFANSTTLAYLVSAQNRAAAAGGRVVLVQPSDFILRTLRTLGLLQVLCIADTVEAATAELSSL